MKKTRTTEYIREKYRGGAGNSEAAAIDQLVESNRGKCKRNFRHKKRRLQWREVT